MKLRINNLKSWIMQKVKKDYYLFDLLSLSTKFGPIHPCSQRTDDLNHARRTRSASCGLRLFRSLSSKNALVFSVLRAWRLSVFPRSIPNHGEKREHNIIWMEITFSFVGKQCWWNVTFMGLRCLGFFTSIYRKWSRVHGFHARVSRRNKAGYTAMQSRTVGQEP